MKRLLSQQADPRFSGLSYADMFSLPSRDISFASRDFLAVLAVGENGEVIVIKGIIEGLMHRDQVAWMYTNLLHLWKQVVPDQEFIWTESPALKQAGIVLLLGILREHQAPLLRAASSSELELNQGALDRICQRLS